MKGRDPQAEALARQGRVVAIVIAAAALLWIGGQWLGQALGWGTSLAVLLDLAAIAAFLWALIMTWGLWRRQQRAGSRDGN